MILKIASNSARKFFKNRLQLFQRIQNHCNMQVYFINVSNISVKEDPDFGDCFHYKKHNKSTDKIALSYTLVR